MKTRTGYRGPTDHSGGNSAANSWAAATAAGKAMASELNIGDIVTYEQYETIAEQEAGELNKALRSRGLHLADNGTVHKVREIEQD